MSLAFAQINLPKATAQIGLDDGVGIESDDRTIHQRRVTLLTHGGRERLDLVALAHPPKSSPYQNEHGRGSAHSQARPRAARKRRRGREGGDLLAALCLGETVQRTP